MAISTTNALLAGDLATKIGAITKAISDLNAGIAEGWTITAFDIKDSGGFGISLVTFPLDVPGSGAAMQAALPVFQGIQAALQAQLAAIPTS